MDRPETWYKVKTLIESGGQVDDIKGALSDITQWETENLYENHRNLLHSAIATNRPEVVELLFENTFQPPHKSNTFPYMLMACALGYDSVVDILLEKRKDFRESVVDLYDRDWKEFVETVPISADRNEDLYNRITQCLMLDKKNHLNAFEVAVLYQHKRCLESLLGLREVPQKRWLRRAARQGIAIFVALFGLWELDLDTLTQGFKLSLNRKHDHRYLEVILEYCKEHDVRLNQPNPLNILSILGKRAPYLSLEFIHKSISLLLEHGVDLSYIDDGGNSLLHHALVRIGVTLGDSHFSRFELPHIRRIVADLTTHRADLQGRNNDGYLPLVTFMKALMASMPPMSYEWRLNMGDENKQRDILLSYLEPILKLLRIMDWWAVYEVVNKSNDLIDDCPNDLMPDSVKAALKAHLHSHYEKQMTLYNHCIVKVWQYCSCGLYDLDALEVPTCVKEDLRGLFTM